ncbi:MAG: domain containing protein [Fibrobacteres bacterium]|nr:domain containing protein [Fibrobacterota bacterium]
MNALKIAVIASLAATAVAERAYSQSCTTMPPQSDFTIEEVAMAPGTPMDIAAAKDGKIYWVERTGAFKSWDPATKAVTTIKNFEVLSSSPGASQYYLAVETGLEGLTLDPEFAINHWVYIRYAVPASKLTGLSAHSLGPIERLSRFTLKNNDKEVDMTTEKTILEYKIYAQCCHFGGDVEFGSDGNIWMTTGDNIHWNYSNTNPYQDANPYSDVRSTSANTNDLRGKTLRIRPLRFPDTETPAPGVGTTYEIPAGNLFPPGTANTRPEVYTMGHRNPFSIGIHPDPAKHWLVIGEAGGMDDDGAGGEDEVNVTTVPGFFGWPFWAGNNVPYNKPNYQGALNPFANPQATPNESKQNTGLKVLPPAIPAAISIATGAFKLANTCLGVTWGWVKYDPMLDSKAKWPPFLEGKALVSAYGSADVNVATVDANGKVTRLDKLFSASPFTTDVLKATQGADGAFYVARGDGINFNASSVARIYRVAYKGACFTVSNRPTASRLAGLLAQRVRVAHMGGNTEVTLPAGIKRAEAYGTDGRLVWESPRSDGAARITRTIPASVANGMLQLRYFQD